MAATGYGKEIYKKALEMKRDEVSKARAAFERKKAVIYAQNPRLSEIDALLLKLGPQIGMTAMSGDSAALERLKESITSLSSEKRELLKTTGLHENQPMCPTCGDSGYIGAKLCSCVQDIAKSLAFSSLSDRMPIDSCRFDNFDLNYYPDTAENSARKGMSKIYSLCKNYAENFSPHSESLLFMGGTGLGKTHLSLAIAGTITNKGYGVIYASAENLLRTLEKEHFSFNREALSIESVLECDLLVLDDLGSEFATSFSTSTIYNIINSRLLTSQPTIISTNLNFDEIEKRYSPRISSRLIGNFIMKRFAGTDIRQQKSVNKRGY